MNIRRIAETYRSMQRMREIVAVLWKHGFHPLLQVTGLARYLPVTQRLRKHEDGSVLGAPEQLRTVLEELGPTFVKLGQMLASRPDLVPEDYVNAFRRLHDHVTPVGFEEIRQIIEAEVGAPMEEVFQSVAGESMAAASIAQIHRAVLADGTPVVMKVRRPGITRVVAQDLSVLRLLVSAVEYYMPESRDLDLPMILDEFSRTIQKEMDLFLEAAHTERLRKNFAEGGEVVIPAVFWELTTDRLLVMEEIEGTPISDMGAMALAGIDRKAVARATARCFLKQVLEDGIFHADLHAGNMLVTPEGRLGLLDFGAVGFLSEDIQQSLGSIFLGLLTRDYSALADEFLKIGHSEGAVDMQRFERDLREMVEPYHGRPLGDLRVGEIMRKGVSISLFHKIRVPAELVMLARSTITVEGVVRQLDPAFAIIEEVEPFARRLMLRHLDPKRQAKVLYRGLRSWREFATRTPSQLGRIFQRLLDARLSIDFVHKGYEQALHEMDRSSNRLSAALIISALIVGSALIVLSGKGPVLWDFPLFGIVGFVIAGVMGFGLAFQIIRSGKF